MSSIPPPTRPSPVPLALLHPAKARCYTRHDGRCTDGQFRAGSLRASRYSSRTRACRRAFWRQNPSQARMTRDRDARDREILVVLSRLDMAEDDGEDEQAGWHSECEEAVRKLVGSYCAWRVWCSRAARSSGWAKRAATCLDRRLASNTSSLFLPPHRSVISFTRCKHVSHP